MPLWKVTAWSQVPVRHLSAGASVRAAVYATGCGQEPHPRKELVQAQQSLHHTAPVLGGLPEHGTVAMGPDWLPQLPCCGSWACTEARPVL